MTRTRSVNYDGKTFWPSDGDPAHATVAHYHQDADLVWGEFAGGEVRRGSLTGTCSPDGVLDFAYTMVLDSGDIVSGRCRSTPRLLEDGRISLDEEWERYTPQPGSGFSRLDEVPSRA
jgi:hypothetical protein